MKYENSSIVFLTSIHLQKQFTKNPFFNQSINQSINSFNQFIHSFPSMMFIGFISIVWTGPKTWPVCIIITHAQFTVNFAEHSITLARTDLCICGHIDGFTSISN
jgi:hypothetical protein